MTNFNISVGLSAEFMESVRQDQPHRVVNPANGETTPLREKIRDREGTLTGYGEKEWSAREVFDLLVKKAHGSGEPGILFLDRINETNPTPALGRMEATNPCGEQPLLPFEACNLGSINLGHFHDPENGIDWDGLRKTIHLSVRFLDDVIDVNRYPKPQIEKIVKGNRKVGLGVMGWADMLYSMKIPYDSREAVDLGRKTMKFIREEGWRASMDLARERGAFPNFDKSVFATENDHPCFPECWREASEKENAPVPVRNATVTTIAPTGTISIIAEASGGIEPLYSLVFERNVMNGEKLREVHPRFLDVAKKEGFHSEELLERIAREGSCRGIDEIPPNWKKVFACAHDVLPEHHMRMQAAFQENCDNAVSKTVNFPANATVEDVRRVYELAAELGVKGVTVYRNGSRKNQPMALSEGETGTASCPIGGCD
jgi:ribonucleoside-diphosphate reductase alpha chain